MKHIKPHFAQLYYHGKPVKRDTSAKTLVIVMQKNKPNRLDMRYKGSREFAKMNKAVFDV